MSEIDEPGDSEKLLLMIVQFALISVNNYIVINQALLCYMYVIN